MCDTVVVVRPDCVLFAKNSDRPPEEAQVIDCSGRESIRRDLFVECTHLRIPQRRRTHAVMLSRPSWMWGAEMATNEYGVTVGNEAVFTRHGVPRTGLTGMDLVRLAVERAESAISAVETILDCGGTVWPRRLLRSSQPQLSLLQQLPRRRSAASLCSRDGWPAPRRRGSPRRTQHLERPDHPWLCRGTQRCDEDLGGALSVRQPRTEANAQRAERSARSALSPARLTGAVAARTGQIDYHPLLGGMTGPCMHAAGLAVDSQTTASWVSRLSRSGDRHLVTATAAPCTGLFKPVSVHEPLDRELLERPPTVALTSTRCFGCTSDFTVW